LHSLTQAIQESFWKTPFQGKHMVLGTDQTTIENRYDTPYFTQFGPFHGPWLSVVRAGTLSN